MSDTAEIRSDQFLEYVKEQHDPANIREDSAPERSTPEIDFKDETLDKGSEINTEQLEVSADQLDAIRSQLEAALAPITAGSRAI